MTLAEAVARTSFKYWRRKMDRLKCHIDGPRSFDQLSDSDREFAMQHAKAVIKAVHRWKRSV